MSLTVNVIETIGHPEHRGVSRAGRDIELIAIVADWRVFSFARIARTVLPNYALDRSGRVFQFVADTRAGSALGMAIHAGRRRRLDRIALSICVEPHPDGPNEPQIESLQVLLHTLLARHNLDLHALITLAPTPAGNRRVVPYLPPAPAVAEEWLTLGGGSSPEQELFVFLLGETYRPRGGALKLSQAFALHAARYNLGAPVGPNEPVPLVVDGRRFNFQPFARDTLFNEGADYAAVQQMSALFDHQRIEIPAHGLARRLLEATYRVTLQASRTRGPVVGVETLRPDWRFHQVARHAGFGPPLSGNYRAADGAYAVQVFAGETLYTPVSEPAGCRYLSATDPRDPAYEPIWRETYKVAGAPYDPASPFHQHALEWKLGAPLTGIYETSHAGVRYQVQVWAYDTLYAGPDGVIRRMSELPRPPQVQAWKPKPAAPPPLPATPPNPLPPPQPPTQAGPPRAGDPSWPPRPDFSILTDHGGARERVLGRIEWVRASGDFIRITNGWDRQHLVEVFIPQLAHVPGGNGGRLLFHRIAAEQLRRLFAAWEAAGLLHLLKTFDGAWVPRTIRLRPTILSNHAYGTAFDINAAWNGMLRVPALVGQPGSVRELVPLANAHGFYWGGHWNFDGKGAADGMHFEWAVAR